MVRLFQQWEDDILCSPLLEHVYTDPSAAREARKACLFHPVGGDDPTWLKLCYDLLLGHQVIPERANEDYRNMLLDDTHRLAISVR